MGLAWDLASGQVVLFGGRDGSGDLGDTWTWDGTDWTQRFPAHSPSTRSHMGMAWDLASGQVVLFGGSNYRADTWTWDGTDWIKRAVADPPSPRTSMGMAYDPIGRRVLLFGGHPQGDCGVGCDYWSDTWTWDGSMWTQLHPRDHPLPLCCMGISSRPRVVVFGGFFHTAIDGSAVSDVTWAWDGTDWHLRST